MKAKLTNKDWTLLAGILVAVIVALTIFFMAPVIETSSDASSLFPASSAVLNNLIKNITGLGRHSIEALFQLLS